MHFISLWFISGGCELCAARSRKKNNNNKKKRVLNHSLIKSVIYAFHSGCIPITVGVSWCSWMDVFSVFCCIFLREFLLDLMLKGSTGHTGGSHEFLSRKTRLKVKIYIEFWVMLRTLKLFWDQFLNYVSYSYSFKKIYFDYQLV